MIPELLTSFFHFVCNWCSLEANTIKKRKAARNLLHERALGQAAQQLQTNKALLSRMIFFTGHNNCYETKWKTFSSVCFYNISAEILIFIIKIKQLFVAFASLAFFRFSGHKFFLVNVFFDKCAFRRSRWDLSSYDEQQESKDLSAREATSIVDRSFGHRLPAAFLHTNFAYCFKVNDVPMK